MNKRVNEIRALIANYDTAEVLEALLEDYLETADFDISSEDMVTVLTDALRETKFIYSNAEDA